MAYHLGISIVVLCEILRVRVRFLRRAMKTSGDLPHLREDGVCPDSRRFVGIRNEIMVAFLVRFSIMNTMQWITVDIQGSYMHRVGFRGRWVTIYLHTYGGAEEVTERYHHHPWQRAVSLVLRGGFDDDIEYADTRTRRHGSLRTYTWQMRHRLLKIIPGTISLFVGLGRTQVPIQPGATEKVAEGYAHWSECRSGGPPVPVMATR